MHGNMNVKYSDSLPLPILFSWWDTIISLLWSDGSIVLTPEE